MAWLIWLVIVFSVLHFLLLLPASLAIGIGAFFTVGLWLLWKLRWIILGIIGLEALFGGGDDRI